MLVGFSKHWETILTNHCTALDIPLCGCNWHQFNANLLIAETMLETCKEPTTTNTRSIINEWRACVNLLTNLTFQWSQGDCVVAYAQHDKIM